MLFSKQPALVNRFVPLPVPQNPPTPPRRAFAGQITLAPVPPKQPALPRLRAPPLSAAVPIVVRPGDDLEEYIERREEERAKVVEGNALNKERQNQAGQDMRDRIAGETLAEMRSDQRLRTEARQDDEQREEARAAGRRARNEAWRNALENMDGDEAAETRTRTGEKRKRQNERASQTVSDGSSDDEYADDMMDAEMLQVSIDDHTNIASGNVPRSQTTTS